MADYALFYDSKNGDRVYNASDFEDWLKKFFTTGIFTGDFLVYSSNGMSIDVSPGFCNIEGKVKNFKSWGNLPVSTADASLGRIDNVVLERNDVERDILLKIVTGTPSNSPIAPNPTRSAGVYQIVIAQVTIPAGSVKITQSNIKDVRENTKLCGLVVGTVKEMDASHLRAQFDAICDKCELEFEKWFDEMKNQLSTDAAGNLQNQINVERERINNLAKMEEGSTTGDAELQDIRVDINGKVHASAGEAVRSQVRETNERLDSLKNATPKEYKLTPITQDSEELRLDSCLVAKGGTEMIGKSFGEAASVSEADGYAVFSKSLKKGDSILFSNAVNLYPSEQCNYIYLVAPDGIVDMVYALDYFNTYKVYTLKEDGMVWFNFQNQGISGIGEYFYVKETSRTEPFVLDAQKAEDYLSDSTEGEAVLKAIMEGRQILIRVPNADGGNYTAIYSPVYMYQLPNYMNGYLHLFYLKDEKQNIDLSELGIGEIQMPIYGELKLLLSRDYNQTPLL